MGSDIALLQLHLSVNFTSHILPACLPECGRNFLLSGLGSHILNDLPAGNKAMDYDISPCRSTAQGQG